MAGTASCFLMRCGVLGTQPGAWASPRWPQLLPTAPGMGWKRELPLVGDQRHSGGGLGGGSVCAGLTWPTTLPAPSQAPARACPPGMQGGGQEGSKGLRNGAGCRGRSRPHPVPVLLPSSLRASRTRSGRADQETLETQYCRNQRRRPLGAGGGGEEPMTQRASQLHVPGMPPPNPLPVLTCLACSGHIRNVGRPGWRQWEVCKIGVLGGSGMDPQSNLECQGGQSQGP